MDHKIKNTFSKGSSTENIGTPMGHQLKNSLPNVIYWKIDSQITKLVRKIQLKVHQWLLIEKKNSPTEIWIHKCITKININ